VRVRVFAAATSAVIFLLSAVAAGHAQTPSGASPVPPPVPGFVPAYEVTRIVRLAGFDPLAPPLREGTTYVLRATDFRGILMRVVVDAHSGAIRAVNRIVPGAALGPIGMMPPPYDNLPPEGGAEFANPRRAPTDEAAVSPGPPGPAIFTAAHPMAVVFPPLPRPRPAELAPRKAAADAASTAVPSVNPAATPGGKSGTPAAAVAPSKAPVATPLND